MPQGTAGASHTTPLTADALHHLPSAHVTQSQPDAPSQGAQVYVGAGVSPQQHGRPAPPQNVRVVPSGQAAPVSVRSLHAGS